MTLAAATRLGPYEILAPLGAGGMGEVYRARDTRLGREVALKVLPPAFAQDPERIARFEREAKLLASLNHPRIGALYGLEEFEGRRVLVLELVAGESLAERLRRGALPIDEALPIAAQVAGALEAAHENGVVHRDLKPGNVMLRPDGTVKVLDFGLAKGGATESTSSDPRLSASPTMTYMGTQAGVILGTAAYMSPEQARGRAVDRRSDIWSLGCLLYELLTGAQAFTGETVSDTLASILKSEPDWSALPPATPARVREILRRCLRKDPNVRLRDAGDARIEIEEVLASPNGDAATNATVTGPRDGRAGRGPLAVLVGVTVLALAFAGWTLLRGGRATGERSMRFAIEAPGDLTASRSMESIALAPDGGTVAFVCQDSSATPAIWLRRLDALTPEHVPATENAIGLCWSPDSRQLAFFADGKLKTVVLATGMVRTLCDAPDPRGLSWGSRGTIVFAATSTGPLQGVNAEGGDVQVVAPVDSTKGEDSARFPSFLPDGRHFLYTSLPRVQGHYAIWVGTLGSKTRRAVMMSDATPVWAGAGCAITVLNDRLVAVHMDPASGAVSGKPMDLGEAPLVLGHDGCPAVSASTEGKLVDCSGSLANSELAWFDRNGRRVGSIPVPAGRWETFAISPDASRIAVTRRLTASETKLWVVDVASGQGGPVGPAAPQASIAWSPDGRTVAYQNEVNGQAQIFLRPADGGAERHLTPKEATFQNLWSWSPDAKTVLYSQPNPVTNWDVMAANVDGGAPRPLLATPANEQGVAVSPDGRWMLYLSDESGRNEVYVRSYPDAGTRKQLGATGLNATTVTSILDWSSDGREVLVASSDIVVYPVEPGPTLQIGGPRRLFAIPPGAISMFPSPDHQRFLVSLPLANAAPPRVTVTSDWWAALKSR